MSMLIPLAGFALGLAVGRWWTVAAAMPFWAAIVWMDQLDGRLTILVASQLKGEPRWQRVAAHCPRQRCFPQQCAGVVFTQAVHSASRSAC